MDLLLYLWISLIIAVVVHELGHLVVARLCGVKVEKFSIGFGKPFFKVRLFDIDWQVTPFLLGGYTQLYGEFNKSEPNTFLYQRYYKKVLILLAGVIMNLLVACICYLINYKSIIYGITVDLSIIKWSLTGQLIKSAYFILMFKPNLFLLQLSLINLFCFITNLLPIPALDGGWIWLVLLEKKLGNNFEKVLKKVNDLGFKFLMWFQVIFVLYILYRSIY